MSHAGRFLLALMVGLGLGQSAQQFTINIPSLGQIRGSQMTSASGKNFHAFRGIPYAEPPIGDLRFRVNYNQINYTCI